MSVKVRPHGKNDWWLHIDHKGVRRKKKVGDRSAAELAATLIRAKLAAGDLSPLDDAQPVAPLLFGDYATTWLADTAKPTCKASTYRGYENNLRLHVLPVLKDVPIAELKRGHLRTLIAACRAKKHSPKTVAKVCGVVSAVLTQAVEDQIISANPAFRLGKHIRQADHITPEINPLSRAETVTFLALVAKHAPRYQPFFLTAVRTGLRLGELIGLQWTDIDFDGGFIEVRRNKVGGILTTPKNGKYRRVDMSKQVGATLKALQVSRKAERLQGGWSFTPKWVFCTDDGLDLDGDNFRSRVWYPFLKVSKFRHIRIHDLRHTFASQLIQNREPLTYVRDQMGHSTIQITADTYGHLIPGDNRHAVDRLDDATYAAAHA